MLIDPLLGPETARVLYSLNNLEHSEIAYETAYETFACASELCHFTAQFVSLVPNLLARYRSPSIPSLTCPHFSSAAVLANTRPGCAPGFFIE